MPTSPAFLEHCLELLAGFGSATARRMFSGHALYLDGLTVALILDDTLFLKTDAETTPRFEAAGSKPFGYQRRGATAIITSYWSAPDEALESPALLAPWLRLAQAAALRAQAARKMPTKKPSPKKPAAKTVAPKPRPPR
jgi:DNA transformation protein